MAEWRAHLALVNLTKLMSMMLKLGNYQQSIMEGHPPVGSKNKGKEIKIERGMEKQQQTRRKIKISRRKQYKIKMANDDEAGPSSRYNPILVFKQLLPHHQEIDDLVTGKEVYELCSHLLGPCMDDKSSLTSSSEDYIRLKTP